MDGNCVWRVFFVLLVLGLTSCVAAPADSPPTALTARPAGPVTPSSPPSEPTATPAEAATLTAQGPWILYAEQAEAGKDTPIVVTNWDGSAPTSLEMPKLRGYYPHQVAAPHGGHLAYKVIEEELDYQLWVVQFPTLTIKKIPLFSPDLREELLTQEGNQRNVVVEERSSLAATLGHQGLFAWSPDGRYLAFPAALEGPTADIYLYDTGTDTLKRLSDEPEQATHVEWSPDGQWLVYQVAREVCYEGCGVDELWAVSVDGEVQHRLYEVQSYRAQILGWPSESTFVVQSRYLEEPSRSLRRVDVSTGTVEMLFDPEGGYGQASLDPASGIVVIDPQDAWGGGRDVRTLLGLIPGETDPRPLPVSTRGGLRWIPEFKSFAADDASGNRFLFRASGEIVLQLPHNGDVWLNPSPDGRWLLVEEPDGAMLYDAQGVLITPIDAIWGELMWLPDSSGFYRSYNPERGSIEPGADEEGHTVIYLHLERDGWKAQIIDQEAAFYSGPLVISP